MAQRAETLNRSEISPANELLPAPPEIGAPADQTLNDLPRSDQAHCAVASDFWSDMNDIVHTFRWRARTYIRDVRQERPLLACAVLAGSCFVVGIALRIWRSRSYE